MFANVLREPFRLLQQEKKTYGPNTVFRSLLLCHLSLLFAETLRTCNTFSFKHCIVGKILLDLYTGHRSLG